MVIDGEGLRAYFFVNSVFGTSKTKQATELYLLPGIQGKPVKTPKTLQS